ncbi:MAG: mandelate racemase/muconate lactonizing enzyme family protein [Candidatus Marinimicrobia bacterium]|nr:mandelate racemase/muconate lactonizing enzyme family protein [Candidatus Neomarinimicrobiota bacterium]
MKINLIDLYYVKLPLEENKPGFFGNPAYFTPSWIPGFRQSEVRFYLLKLGTDQGVEGYATMPAMGPERKGLGPLMGNYIMGINPMDIQLVNQRIQEFSYIGMRNGWIDAAFWDIIGKVRGEPLWKILGGEGGYVYPYISTGSTHNHDQGKISQISKQFLDSGYKGIKIRVKSDELAPMEDFVGAARSTIGDTMDLMVDANQGWPVDLFDETPKWDLEFASKFAQSIEQYNVKWLEEPLNRGNFEGFAKLRKNTKTPIAGGELNSTWRDFRAMLDMGSLDIYQPDAVMAGGTYAGGISIAYWLIREIQKRNKENQSDSQKLKFCPHTWTTGLGFALALQLVGVLPSKERGLLEYPVEGNWKPEYWSRFIKGGFNPDNEGRIKIPEGPGLGIEIDWDIIQRFGKRIYHGTPKTVAYTTLLDRGFKQTMYLKKKKAVQLKRTAKAQFKIPEPPF